MEPLNPTKILNEETTIRSTESLFSLIMNMFVKNPNINNTDLKFKLIQLLIANDKFINANTISDFNSAVKKRGISLSLFYKPNSISIEKTISLEINLKLESVLFSVEFKQDNFRLKFKLKEGCPISKYILNIHPHYNFGDNFYLLFEEKTPKTVIDLLLNRELSYEEVKIFITLLFYELAHKAITSNPNINIDLISRIFDGKLNNIISQNLGQIYQDIFTYKIALSDLTLENLLDKDFIVLFEISKEEAIKANPEIVLMKIKSHYSNTSIVDELRSFEDIIRDMIQVSKTTTNQLLIKKILEQERFFLNSDIICALLRNSNIDLKWMQRQFKYAVEQNLSKNHLDDKENTRKCIKLVIDIIKELGIGSKYLIGLVHPLCLALEINSSIFNSTDSQQSQTEIQPTEGDENNNKLVDYIIEASSNSEVNAAGLEECIESLRGISSETKDKVTLEKCLNRIIDILKNVDINSLIAIKCIKTLSNAKFEDIAKKCIAIVIALSENPEINNNDTLEACVIALKNIPTHWEYKLTSERINECVDGIIKILQNSKINDFALRYCIDTLKYIPKYSKNITKTCIKKCANSIIRTLQIRALNNSVENFETCLEGLGDIANINYPEIAEKCINYVIGTLKNVDINSSIAKTCIKILGKVENKHIINKSLTNIIETSQNFRADDSMLKRCVDSLQIMLISVSKRIPKNEDINKECISSIGNILLLENIDIDTAKYLANMAKNIAEKIDKVSQIDEFAFRRYTSRNLLESYVSENFIPDAFVLERCINSLKSTAENILKKISKNKDICKECVKGINNILLFENIDINSSVTESCIQILGSFGKLNDEQISNYVDNIVKISQNPKVSREILKYCVESLRKLSTDNKDIAEKCVDGIINSFRNFNLNVVREGDTGNINMDINFFKDHASALVEIIENLKEDREIIDYIVNNSGAEVKYDIDYNNYLADAANLVKSINLLGEIVRKIPKNKYIAEKYINSIINVIDIFNTKYCMTLLNDIIEKNPKNKDIVKKNIDKYIDNKISIIEKPDIDFGNMINNLRILGEITNENQKNKEINKKYINIAEKCSIKLYQALTEFIKNENISKKACEAYMVFALSIPKNIDSNSFIRKICIWGFSMIINANLGEKIDEITAKNIINILQNSEINNKILQKYTNMLAKIAKRNPENKDIVVKCMNELEQTEKYQKNEKYEKHRIQTKDDDEYMVLEGQCDNFTKAGNIVEIQKSITNFEPQKKELIKQIRKHNENQDNLAL